MPIETWFPLAVYYDDLKPSAEVQQGMIERLAPFLDAYKATQSNGFAWTGDTRSCWQIHRFSEFAWLRREVERHVLNYTRALGANLAVMSFHFQRSWPIFSRMSEKVSPHTHPNANISAVYYLQVSDALQSGHLCFHNEGEPNALGPDLSGHATHGIAEWNAFNYLSARYAPVQGRLLLFPSRQPHSVEANASSELRISLSFDIAVTCSTLADPGRHEFLAPPPTMWDEFRPMDQQA